MLEKRDGGPYGKVDHPAIGLAESPAIAQPERPRRRSPGEAGHGAMDGRTEGPCNYST